MTYEVELTPPAKRALKKLERRDREAAKDVLLVLAELAEDPRPYGVRALTNRPGQLRYRTGNLRVVYTVQDSQLLVLVLALGYRRDVYGR